MKKNSASETADQKESFLKKVTTDLFNIRISTIVCDNISAEDMPRPSIAIRQVAEAYGKTLLNKNIISEPFEFDMNARVTVFSKISSAIAGYFKENTYASLNEKPDEQKSFWFILYRMQQMSDQLNLALSDKDNPEACDRGICCDLIVLLRKAWEIGVDEIALNTIIGIDGDILTRINRKYANPGYSCLHSIHHNGINVCLEWWKELFGILNNFVNTLFKKK